MQLSNPGNTSVHIWLLHLLYSLHKNVPHLNHYVIRATRNSCIIPSLPGISRHFFNGACSSSGEFFLFPPRFHPFLCDIVEHKNGYVKVCCGVSRVRLFENASKWGKGGPCMSPPTPLHTHTHTLPSSVMQLKWVFLTPYSVKLSGEFGLVLSR